MISIIIPIYNAEKTISAIVHDIKNQDYFDYQVLLIDDGSTDKSGEYGKKFQDQDKRFHYVYQQNAGVSSARNHGLRIAKGEYITFLDADDRIDTNYLSSLLHSCVTYNSDIAVCNVIVHRKNDVKMIFSVENGLLQQKDALNLLLSRRKINSGPYAKLFRRKTLYDLSFPEIKTYEDIIFVKDAFCNAESISMTNETGYHYIENDDGAMKKFLSSPTMDIIIATENLADFIKSYKTLNSKTFYITLSHLMQYVTSMYPFQGEEKVYEFMINTKKVFAKYRKDIMFCSAFPWKEKILFELYSVGYLYNDGKISKYIKKK